LLATADVEDKDYTHLIGVGCELPGMGQRCRITGGATTDITEVITLSANGCMFKNVQIANWADADADAGRSLSLVVVTCLTKCS
jgi:hypothetical protein